MYLSPFTLVGEIVGSECYLGVMNLGETKVPRECPVRCRRGGISLLLMVRDTVGNKVALQLVSASSAPVNQDVLAFVAEPVEITGPVVRMGEQLWLKSEPQIYKL